jgi:crotonobetainyl-CoA:carnitine CoA-transferase CaiB-like acyl-CoA transferase
MPGPLAGLKVLDFSTLLPGPFATMMLADLGAEVLKVESPSRPDNVRLAPPYDGEVSAVHMAVNRNKRAIALDLKTPEGVALARRLVKTYDIVLEQFRPGVMKRLGLDYETLKAENEGLIYCSLTGYGQDGPYVLRAGHDINYLAIAGVHSVSGRKEHGPVPQGYPLADIGGGSYNTVVGILAAVIHRNKTGEGQYIDVSMTDGALAYVTMVATQSLVGGENPGYETEFLNGGSFYDCYRTRDGRYMSVGSIEPQFFRDLCKGIGREDLIEGYGWGLEVGEAWAKTKAEMVEIFASRTLDEWVAIFKDLDACVEPVLTMPEVVEHPQIKARNMVAEVKKPDGSTQRQINSPFRFSKTPPQLRHTGPELGEHTVRVLEEMGCSEAEIETLRKKGVI